MQPSAEEVPLCEIHLKGGMSPWARHVVAHAGAGDLASVEAGLRVSGTLWRLLRVVHVDGSSPAVCALSCGYPVLGAPRLMPVCVAALC